MQANPQIDRFTLAEGHKILLHSYEHPRLTNLSANGLRFQVEGAAALFAANGAPLSHKVLRAPFGGTNAAVNEAVAAMGYAMDGSGSAGTLDYDPVRTAAQIRDAMVAALRPGRGLVLHDGPIDTPAGQAMVDAIRMIVDEAQARGYCFGTLDEPAASSRAATSTPACRSRRSPTRSPTSRPRTRGRRRRRTSSSRSRCGSRPRTRPPSSCAAARARSR